ADETGGPVRLSGRRHGPPGPRGCRASRVVGEPGGSIPAKSALTAPAATATLPPAQPAGASFRSNPHPRPQALGATGDPPDRSRGSRKGDFPGSGGKTRLTMPSNPNTTSHRALVIIPGTVNYFYNLSGERIAEALRELGFSVVINTLPDCAEDEYDWCL